MADANGSRAFESAVTEIDRRIAELQRARETLLRLMAQPAGDTPVAEAAPGVAVGDPLATVREQEFSGMSVAKAAAAFLRKIGRHEKTNTIIAAIRKGGVEMNSKNPITTVYTTLSRRPGFVSLGKNYWDLAERRPDLAAQEKKPRPIKHRRRRTREIKVEKRVVARTPVRMPTTEAVSA